MAYILQFPTFTQYEQTVSVCDRDGSISRSPIFTWLMYGKLPETTTVVPSRVDQSITPSAKNRYLEEVIVKGISAVTQTVTLAVGATLLISTIGVGSVSSSSTSIATGEVSDNIITITGVSAGSAIITVKDTSNDLMYTVNVTVS